MHFHLSEAVFELVALASGVRGELPRLAHRDESRSEAVGDRGREVESSRLDSNDLIDAGIREQGRESVENGPKVVGTLQEGRDVVEIDTELRISWPRGIGAQIRSYVPPSPERTNLSSGAWSRASAARRAVI